MTLVVDASVVADLVLSTERSHAVRSALADHALLAPELLVPEVMSVVRRHLLRGRLIEHRAGAAVDDALALGVRQVGMEELVPRAWAHRHRISGYDAMYVALAEVTGAPLLTGDVRLASAAEGVVDVIVPA